MPFSLESALVHFFSGRPMYFVPHFEVKVAYPVVHQQMPFTDYASVVHVVLLPSKGHEPSYLEGKGRQAWRVQGQRLSWHDFFGYPCPFAVAYIVAQHDTSEGHWRVHLLKVRSLRSR